MCSPAETSPDGGLPVRRLADDNEIPLLGLGVWQVPDGPGCVAAVRAALEVGYRHIDTAQAYGNEESVGRALRESGVNREEVFLTTKFYPGSRDPAAELEGSLRRLGVDRVDLYLVHWPQGGPSWAWPSMEKARARGHARSIGVSNFSAGQLGELEASSGDSPPMVNQVQFSPFEHRSDLLAECKSRDIVLEAYSPLGTGRHLGDVDVSRVASAHGASAAQVLLRWCVQREIPVIPKSTNPWRIAENAAIFDFELSEAEMAALDALDTTDGTAEAREGQWW